MACRYKCCKSRAAFLLALFAARALAWDAPSTCAAGSWTPDLRAQAAAAASWEPDKPNQTQVSVVLLDWKRPKNVEEILAKLTSTDYPMVGEVLVVHNNPNSRFSYSHPKVFVFHTTSLFDAYAMTDRFKACLLATLEWCVLFDDDLLVTPHGFRRLMKAKAEQPDRIYSFVGNARNYNDSDPMYKFCCSSQSGESSIVVGRTMFVDKRMARLFFDLKGVMEDVAYLGATPWGVEDIYMSVVVRAKTGNKAFALKKVRRRNNFIDKPPGTVGISKNRGHLPFRRLFLRTALTRLHCLFPANIPSFVDTRLLSMAPGRRNQAHPPAENPATGLARWAVVTATSEHRKMLFSASVGPMHRYARAADADFLVIEMSLPIEVKETMQAHKRKWGRKVISPYINKLLVLGRLLEVGYERVLWLDDSALVLPGAESLFTSPLTEGADVAGFDESSITSMRSYKADRRFLRKARNIRVADSDPYINTGVLMVGQKMRKALQVNSIIENIDLFESNYPTQCYLSYILAIEAFQVARLPERFNFMAVEGYRPGSPNGLQSFKPERLDHICNQTIIHLTGYYVNRNELLSKVKDECDVRSRVTPVTGVTRVTT